MADKRLNLSVDREKRRVKSAVKESTASKTDSASKSDEDDAEILSDLPERGKSKNTMLFIVLGVAIVVVAIFVFLVFIGGKDRGTSGTAETLSPQTSVQPNGGTSVSTPVPSGGSSIPSGMGTQDFTQNTNMTTSSVLTDPDQYIEDLYGLTTRVDYTVSNISSVADFVSYTKHRGTWGGGLELYWLEADYKGSKYVIQVPFEYYKELDDTGIVPVKMEVLTIAGSTADEKLTVISYMCLDEKVLEDILKNQAKSK